MHNDCAQIKQHAQYSCIFVQLPLYMYNDCAGKKNQSLFPPHATFLIYFESIKAYFDLFCILFNSNNIYSTVNKPNSYVEHTEL